MPTIRRSESSKTHSGIMQSGLGFAAKKSIHPSPAKKKAQAVRSTPEPTQSIDLTTSSPPAPKRTTSTINPFEEDEDNRPAVVRSVERDEFGFVKSVPSDFAPLGKGKPTAEMLANLVGTTKEDENSEDFDDAKEEQLKARKAMDKALDEIESIRNSKLAPVSKPATPQTHDRMDQILRVFDLSTEWGPCTGMTRLERWNRAEAWGLEPPTQVRDILLTQQGATDSSYRETIFHDRGIYVP